MKVTQPKPPLRDARANPLMQADDAAIAAWVDQNAQSPAAIRAVLKTVLQTQRDILRHLNGRT